MSEPAKLNLYRKYRPQTFAELLGQDHIVRTLQASVASGRIAHAYLFSGPRGTGKTSAARLLAKILNCRSPITVGKGLSDACRTCDICQRIEGLYFMDIVEIDAASNNSVDDIRQMREKVKYLPVEGQFKVYIIDEVHMLSGAAFNAFLKTLEEPPPRVVFVLATTDPQKVPPTILSRCQCFDFHSIPRKVLVQRLSEVVRREREDPAAHFPEVEPQALHLIAECAQGGFRDALSLLDQITASGNDEAVTLDQVLKMTRRLGYATLKQLSLCLFGKDVSGLLHQLSDLYFRGHEVAALGRDLLEYLRQCLLLRIDPRAAEILEIPAEQAQEIKDQVKPLPVEYLMAVILRLERTLQAMRHSVQPRVLLEVELVRMTLREISLGLEGMERRLSQVEDRLRSPSITFSRPTTAVPTGTPAPFSGGSAPIPLHPSTNPGPLTVGQPAGAVRRASSPMDIFEKFRLFKAELSRTSKITGAVYQTATLESVRSGEAVIRMDTDFAVTRGTEPKALEQVKILLENQFGPLEKVTLRGPGSKTGSGETKDKAHSAAVSNHQEQIARIDQASRKKILEKPAVADALGVFGGEVIQIEKPDIK